MLFKKILLINFILFSFIISAQSFLDLDSVNIEEKMEFYNVPKISLSVIEGSSIIDTRIFGYQDINSRFQAGSMTMPLTTLAVFTLVEAGFVDLDTNVNEYLVNWKVPDTIVTRNRKLTLRILLTHMGGIRESGPLGYVGEAPTLDELLSNIYIRFYPGLKRRFSWSGYSIIQKVIEDVTGDSYTKYIQDTILTPLEMNNSGFEPGESYIKGTDLFGNEVDGGFHNYSSFGSMGLWTTSEDMAKLLIELYNIENSEYAGIVTKESLNQILTYQKGGWGLGISLDKVGDNLVIRHSGFSYGYVNYFIYRIRSGQGLVIMESGDNGWKLIMEILHSIKKYKDWGI